MPALIPLAAGIVIGVCIAPSVRKHPKLQAAFEIVDGLQAAVLDAWQTLQLTCNTLVSSKQSPSLHLYNPN